MKKYILLSLFFCTASILMGQEKKLTISGHVFDENNESLPGVSVYLKDRAGVGTSTDVDGAFKLSAQKGDMIIFSFIGYKKKEHIALKDEKDLKIILKNDAQQMDEVVITGMGTKEKKVNLTGAVTNVDISQIQTPATSLTNMLGGRVPGIISVQSSGEPGSNMSEFWIRGISSFAGGTSPLVLVDGVPRSMNDITVDEIESFTVLKDASATAVYGAEGANGVVLITSKRGSSQKPTLDVRAEFGIAKPTRLPNLANSYEFAQLYNEAAWEVAGAPASGFINPYSDHDLEMYRTGEDPDLYPNADFLSLLKDQTFNQRVSLNLRGGGDKVRYFVSGSFYHEDGMFNSQSTEDYNANIGLSRYNIRSNIDIDVTKTTLLAVDISGQYTD